MKLRSRNKRKSGTPEHKPAKILPLRLNSSPIPTADCLLTPSPSSLPSRPFAAIPDGYSDATLYSKFQLLYIHQQFTSYFMQSMSFSRVSDSALYEMAEEGIFKPKWINTHHVIIPITAKQTYKDLKKFFSLGNHQQRLKSREQEFASNEFRYLHPLAKYCLGIGLPNILSGSRSEKVKHAKEVGFHALTRASMVEKAQCLKCGDCTTEILNSEGYFTIGSTSKPDKARSLYLRKVFEVISSKDQYAFSCSHKCIENSVADESIMCSDCSSNLELIKMKCYKKGLSKDSEFHESTNLRFLLSSPTDLKGKIKDTQVKLKNLRSAFHYRNKVQKAKALMRDGIMGNESISGLFDNDFAVESKKWMQSQEGIGKDHIAHILRSECLQAMKRSQTHGKYNVRYSPLMIRFAISLRKKLKNSGYNFVKKLANLPSLSTLDTYDSPDTNSKDGPLFEAIREVARKIHRKHVSLPSKFICNKISLNYTVSKF